MASRDEQLTALVDRLDDEQRAAVTAEPGPVAILAGAGTGKTRTVTHRIAWRVVRGDLLGQHVTAVTFTARAAGEMRDRLRQLGVTGVNARTFHSAALRQLRYFGAKRFGGAIPDLMDSTVKFVSIAAARAGVDTNRPKNLDLAAEIEWAASSLIGPDRYVAAVESMGRDSPMKPIEVAKVYAAYEEAKERAHVMDFSDVIAHTADLIENDAAVADRIRGQYRFFVVDEYQDVTPLQQRLLDAWLGERDDITVVGDASQTVYSFTGATSDYLLDFTRRWPEARLIRLERDYRSTPEIVGLANKVISKASGKEAAARLELVGQRESGPEVTGDAYSDEAEEADMVARQCARLVREGTPPGEIAVLYRTNAQSQMYEECMAEYGIPTVVKGAGRFFARPEIRQAMVALRSALNTDVASLPLLEAVEQALEATGWRRGSVPSGGAQREQYEAIMALVRLAEQFSEGDLSTFCQELNRRASEQHAPQVDGVTLASLHAAKGLEWDTVFLVGLADGTLPTTFARSDAAKEEERRLLYVGVTRARLRLHLSFALLRQGGVRERRLCRFLRDADVSGFPRSVTPKNEGSESKVARKRPITVVCSGCEKPLTAARDRKLGHCEDCPSTMDEELHERLTQWRLETARRSGKPAFTIFTDVTLTAIAERSPASNEELSEIYGIGKYKLDRFAEAVLFLVNGGSVAEAVELPDDS
ncbi:ATP-dependent DNA helicase UvrD2 [Haloglycomyces albus]|uniref:ATP-dependent DNA helicase UvrD2 n=1 Tax=Haloglycomyces albus TaxID=526067 RepID=UPI00046CF0FA|nr:ATP-dependent DNA helicase UvrD2 [Haloglycomyces albus]